ncbi:MAG: hypothetical protein KBS56_03440 [Clostridiales bacterium]|nr:hypothetical protein [Candidatus Crickella equi]
MKNLTSNKTATGKSKTVKRIIIAAVCMLLVAALVCGGLVIRNYTHVSYALHSLDEYRQMYLDVNIEELDNDIIRYSPKKDASGIGIAFYPGCTVEYYAYSPLLAELAEEGYIVYLFEMPHNVATSAPERANEIIGQDSDVTKWYISGHSAGGVGAEMYLVENADKVDGAVIFASSAKEDMTGIDVPMITVYGSRDTVVGKSLQRRIVNNPPDTEMFCIEGANHAQFGDYGKQTFDSDATISDEEQRKQAVAYVTDWISRH